MRGPCRASAGTADSYRNGWPIWLGISGRHRRNTQSKPVLFTDLAAPHCHPRLWRQIRQPDPCFELARVRRGAATFTLDLAVGRPDIFPEMPVKLTGWPDAITAYEWIVSKVRHKLDGNGGYLTSLELENKAAASDHAAVDVVNS